MTAHTSPALPTDPERDHFRGFARRPVNLAANVIAGGGSWQRQARVLDLGLGGARVALSEVIPPSTPLSLIIDAPHLWAPLEIEARVAWAQHDATQPEVLLGVAFQHRTGKSLLLLTALLEAAAFS